MLNKYLKWLNEESEPESESVGGFAIDSYDAKSKPLSVVYPESVEEEDIKQKEMIENFLDEDDII